MQVPTSKKNNKDNIDSQLDLKKSFFSIFLAFFIFLSLVLSLQSWHQWSETKENHTNDMIQTVDSFVTQTSLTAKASIHVNKIFSDIHKKDLVGLTIRKNPEVEDYLRQEMTKSFFHYTGYMLVNSEGDILYMDGPVLSDNERPFITNSFKNARPGNHFFAKHYDVSKIGDISKSNGFYSYNWFEYENERYGFIIRRPYNNFSKIIFNADFLDYQLALYEKDADKIIISRNLYHTEKDTFSLSSVADDISYRRAISLTPWEVIAIDDKNHAFNSALKSIFPSIIVLLIFLAVSYILRLYLKKLIRKQKIEASARREIEQRAEKSLMSIDEAIIITDVNKIITYVNPRAKLIFGRLGYKYAIGASLSEIWQDKDSLWTDELSIKDLESVTNEEHRELHLSIEGEAFILHQTYNLLYDEGDISGAVWLLRDVTDEVINRRALEESRSRYKAIFDEATIAHCILLLPKKGEHSNTARITTANDAALKLFHADSQNHLIKAFPKLISQQGNDLHENIERAIEEGRNWIDFEIQVTNIQGKEIALWVNLGLQAGGKNTALVTFIDITDRKKATTELFNREQFWSKIMDEIVDLVYVLSVDEEMTPSIEYSNKSLNKILGVPMPSSPKFGDWNIEFHPEDFQKLSKLLVRSRKLDPDETVLETCRVKDGKGQWRTIRFTNKAFDYDENGLATRFLSSLLDVTEEVEAQIKLIENERRYRLLAENVTDVIWAVDENLQFTFISSSIHSMLHYHPDEIYKGAIKDVFVPEDVKKLNFNLKQALKNSNTASREAGDDIFKMDLTATTKDNKKLILELQASYLWDEQKELEGIFGVVRNVTEARKIESELLLAGQVFENSTEAILVTDNYGYVINANPAFFEASQFSPEEIRGLRPDDIINPKFHSTEFYAEVGQSVLQDSYWQGEVHYLRKNGEERVSWTGISATRSRSGKVQNFIIIVSDITERKVIERKIHKLAYFDPLTGLPNRSQMHERLDQMVVKARETNTFIAVLFLDLDRFKPINDSMGHPAGDSVLKDVADRLRRCIKDVDLVSRMSGDEFTIALANQKTAESASRTAVKVGERILYELQQPFLIEQRNLFLTGSIGVAIFPNDGKTVIELLKNSDMAMYHAKDDGRNNVQFFDEVMNKKAVELLEMENDLRYAIERGELELYYQPQFSAHDCSLQGVEALLRWHHNERGMVSPEYFIPIIEATGLIIPIGEWVLRQACTQLVRWQDQGIPVNRMAINVSGHQFKQPEFIDLLQTVIKETGIDANQLELELTESILMDNLELTLAVLNRLRDMGVRMAVDDFGTGYSSLNYLKQFPVDTLKIDRSFISGLPENLDDAQITRTIMSMAHNLGLGVIAEGVETKEQLDFLQQIQCEEIQGFYFSKPLPVKELVQFTKKDHEFPPVIMPPLPKKS